MYKNVIIASVSVLLISGLYFYIRSLKVRLNEVKFELLGTQTELANSKLESNRYKSELDVQSREVEIMKASRKSAIHKLMVWKSKKPEVKYKTITKIREVKSNECKNITDTIDSVRNIDYNSL